MRRIAISAAVAAILAASCQQAEAPRVPSEAAPPAPEAASPQPEAAAKKGMGVLEGWGVRLPFGHYVAYDLIDHNRVGTPRHRVLLEVTGGSMTDAVAGMEQALTAVGYAKSTETESGGRLDQVFRKAGSPTLVLRSQPAAIGPKLKQTGAVGSIHVMWNKR